MLRHVNAIRYVTPLREGGSLPGVMEADDLGSYVVKFAGAGQGRRVLVAEVICGGIARALELPIPELVTVEVAAALGRAEADQEIQQLLVSSAGLNLGMDFLPGSLDFETAAGSVDPALAGRVLWFDAYIGNVDRSWRNPNLLMWHGRPYLIDHGAALTFHHNWSTAAASAARPFDAADHLMVGFSPHVDEADEVSTAALSRRVLTEVTADVPDEWLTDEPGFGNPDAVREGYVDWLVARLEARDSWLLGVKAAAQVGRQPTAAPRDNRPSWLKTTPPGASR